MPHERLERQLCTVRLSRKASQVAARTALSSLSGCFPGSLVQYLDIVRWPLTADFGNNSYLGNFGGSIANEE